jgi:hypothetical protein
VNKTVISHFPPSPTQQSGLEGSKDKTPRWKKAVEVSIALGSLGLLGVNVFLWLATGESNRINREGLESVQRAFVSFLFSINAQGVVDPKTKKVVQWNFSIPVINDGSTPTRNMVMHFEVYPSRDELPYNFTFPDTSTVTRQLIVLGPKHTTYSAYFGRVRPEAIDALRRGQGHLYFYGWTTYNDVFPNTPQHITKFCFELSQFGMDAFTGAGPENTFYTAWKRHNCADSECAKEP